jgi:sporulation protein YlmC with PRC-barrel domain
VELALLSHFAPRAFRSSNQELEPSTSLDVLTAPLSMEESMKTLLIISLLGVAALIGSPALAQNPQPADRPAAANPAPSDANKMMLKGHWRASKLMGLDVYNQNNEKLGDVNELILDKNGKVAAVVIGVGGFLGMGEHDIAVSLDKLKFVEEPIRTSSTGSAPARDTATPARDSTTGAANPPATTPARNANTNDWVPDHAVMNASKEQLKAMPQFKYSDYN